MTEPRVCPFCEQPITPQQYKRLEERIRKAEDPAILRELETLSAGLSAKVRAEMESEYAPLRRQLESYRKREKELNERASDLTLKEAAIDSEVAKRLAQKQKALIAAAREQAKQEFESQAREKDRAIADLKKQVGQLNEQIETRVSDGVRAREAQIREQEQKRAEAKYGPILEKVKEYQKKELELERAGQELALQREALDLEVQKRLSAERESLVRQASKQVEEKYNMDKKEKDRTIQQLSEQVEQLQERLQSGSPQTRGDIQQEDIAELLGDLYSDDEIVEIKRGVHGADVLQRVKTRSGTPMGSILWESKRTQDFQPKWIEKLREDQRDQKADVAILVSRVLPEEVEHFSLTEGVILCELQLVSALSSVTRQHLIALGRQKLTLEQRETKTQDLYAYMTGKEFQQRIAGIVEATVGLQGLLEQEMRSHQKVWAHRRKLQERAMAQTALLYGEIAGIVGTLPPVPKLELPGGTMELPPESEGSAPLEIPTSEGSHDAPDSDGEDIPF